MENSSGDEVRQVQSGWLACNWRKTQATNTCERWNKRAAEFRKYIETLEEIIYKAEIVFEQVEVTYVNLINQADLWKTIIESMNVFGFLTWPVDPFDSSKFLSELDSLDIRLSSPIRRDNQENVTGRLHVRAFSTVVTASRESMLNFSSLREVNH